ncbi:sulfite exporter TauE/SafE family protein [Acidaminobacter sp. JC074]|uniref:sulfite exporter TauE/SafE family protein n=1 Tax=Acidaminobacter sp. JC074 TaxID=2530199 RepID=UPI001F1157ED|nr:sulfite exporter TauE/SafE family protein [Acidaminobacter sp. JC074]MCH4887498.1 sulfite exporter TauE/SafE family protein [Acidaminobacter sp. JC074]
MVIFAGIITFIFTTLLTIAGEGAAIILIPTYQALGFDIHVAMSTALLLNALAMIIASIRYYKRKLIMFKIAVPIIVVATVFSQLGAMVSKNLSSTVLNSLFVLFLLYASSKIFLTKKEKSVHKEASYRFGILMGAIAGFLAGLLGIGGGNLILPVLISLGYDSKKASATTAFIVIFSSLSGFLGHLGGGSVDTGLVSITALAALAGGFLGSWLMTEKLKSKQVKYLVGFVLLAVATKKAMGLIAIFI